MRQSVSAGSAMAAGPASGCVAARLPDGVARVTIFVPFHVTLRIVPGAQISSGLCVAVSPVRASVPPFTVA